MLPIRVVRAPMAHTLGVGYRGMKWRGRPLGDWYTDRGAEYSDQLACIKIANASPWVSKIDAQIGDLASGWNPTGYFTPAEVQSLLDELATQAAAAGAALAAAPRSTGDAEQMIAQAFDDLVNRYQVRARLYAADVAKARAAGINVIDAPALKDWVISSMRAISDAYSTAVVMYCRQSSVESILNRAFNAMASVGAVAWRVVGIVYKAGQAALKAADSLFSLTKWLVKWGPTIAIGAGAYFGYKHFIAKR